MIVRRTGSLRDGAYVGFGSRLCENSFVQQSREISTSQNALYSIIFVCGRVRGPPKTKWTYVFTQPYMDTARLAKLIFDVTPQRGTGCSLISGLVMQAEACGP